MKRTHYTMTIRWTETQEVGAPITRQHVEDVTDRVYEADADGQSRDSAFEEMLEGRGYKIRSEVGRPFIEFTYGSVDAQA